MNLPGADILSPEAAFYLTLAISAGLGGWGATQIGLAFIHPDRKKLRDRISAEMTSGMGLAEAALSIEKPREALADLLGRSPFLRELNRRLAQVFPHVSLLRFLLIAGGIAAGTGLACIYYLPSLMVSILIAGLAGALPFMVLGHYYTRRQRMLADQLIDALDFLSRILRAGHSLATGIQMVGQELPEPIAGEFRRCHDQHVLGEPLERSMTQMAGRVGIKDFAFFVTAVLIQRQTGGDLAEVLDNIAGMVRNRVRLQQHLKALTAEGRLTGWIMLALPVLLFVFLYIRKPDYIGVLLTTETGRALLFGVAGLQVAGILLIRRILRV